jgi:hypothetical protein
MADPFVVRIIVDVILFFIGAAVLNGLSKGIIKGKNAGSFGIACVVMLIWIIMFTLLDMFLRPLMITAIPNDLFAYFLMILILWFTFALIIMLFYSCSFGRGLGVGILLAIIMFVLSIVITILVEFLLFLMGF